VRGVGELEPVEQRAGAVSRFAACRTHVRRSLYMATIVATQHNTLIRRHYRHLLTRGKTKMTALVACMRKLLLILNAMIKNNSPWKETLAS
jgi:transposase